MSLNRYEQALFDYLGRQPDERRHWQTKVVEVTRGMAEPAGGARGLERELWEYFSERCQQVPELRGLQGAEMRRISLLNLAEHLMRIWGPVPRPKKPNIL